ncbi:glutaredoxin-1 [Mucor mucedo]|uniref:glutaredoxin-1 n=1 Tax=Mucor mucedo TaxID=29922 RepID=UPI00221E767C|nr:glutaredoxin-1 [Mucor mucedo]KAI7890530.1 glutaredoxin-1 [Mucor mucedo]
MAQVQELVEKIIESNKVVVFSKSYCPYCVKAKAVLKEFGVEFFVMELDKESNGSAVQQYLAEKTGQRTVPNIFINQQHIGGCDDLLAAKANGSLKKLLL